VEHVYDAGIVHNLAILPLGEARSIRPLASGDNRIECTPLEAILGMEGAGSAAYFQCFGKLMSNQKQWPFARRIKRPPTDPVNSLLSFGYSLLTNQVASAVQLVGFDHFVSFLRQPRYGRPALDLMEEFRPIIVDSVVLNTVNHLMLTAQDFQEELGGAVYLRP
jgi:CRISPR-associated protein Cas1